MTQTIPDTPGTDAAPPSRSRVAVVYTTPETVLDDIGHVMRLAGYKETLDPTASTLLKVNISWQLWYPACSTTPWQLDGVIKTLKDDGFQDIIAAHNGTVVVDAKVGEVNNKHLPVIEKHGIPNTHLEDVEWMQFQPKAEMRVLGDIFPDGLRIPAMFPGKNIIHLPTVKTHVFTTMTGAMKNAFGGLLNHRRHWTHSVIHETLVDLLAIQKEIHPGLFAVMDGTFVGDGPGPRAMKWQTKNILMASSDQVAIDAISAKLMGIDPMSIKFIRLAHEAGLGTGDPREIDIVGEDVSEVNWHLKASEDTFASRGQKLIYWGPLKRLEHLLLRTVIAPWSYVASNLYFNGYWYNAIGRGRARKALDTPWGKLFRSY